MNVFQVRIKIVADYTNIIRSFLKIADTAIRSCVEGELEQGKPKQDESHGEICSHERPRHLP